MVKLHVFILFTFSCRFSSLTGITADDDDDDDVLKLRIRLFFLHISDDDDVDVNTSFRFILDGPATAELSDEVYTICNDYHRLF